MYTVARNRGESSSSSSSSSSVPRPQQHDERHDTQPSYDIAAASRSCITAFSNLSLHRPEENGVSNQRSRLAASAAMYLPQTMDDFPIYPGRINFGQQIRNSGSGMPYYSPMSPSPYIREQPILGMGQIYQPNMFGGVGSPHVSPFLQSPTNVGYQFPNNVAFPGLASPYPPFPAAEEPLITEEMLNEILLKPYEYMTSATLNRSLTKLLFRLRRTKFIDNFILAVTKSRKSLVDAACTYYGTCVLQTLIKVAKKRPIIAHIPLVLADETERLMKHQSGMHVIKQCFIELDEYKYEPLFDKLMENNNWVGIAKNQHGCRGLNECLDNMVDRFKSLLHTGIAVFASHLALDIYGTYIVQHVIDLRTIHTEQIVESILPFLDVLVTIKNGSHLVEKCLETPYCYRVIEALMDSNKVVKYALHECANYVIQAAIKCARGSNRGQYERLTRMLSKERSMLQVNKHGKHVAKLLPNQQQR